MAVNGLVILVSSTKQPYTTLSFIYRQAMNPCLWHRVRFTHPHLQHGFRACWGLCPRIPGCIPILVLAALIPNHQSWLCFIPILVLPKLYPNHQSCLSSIIISVFAAFLICPSLLSIHLFTSAYLPHLSMCSICSICPPIHICPPVHICPSVLSTCSHLSIYSVCPVAYICEWTAYLILYIT